MHYKGSCGTNKFVIIVLASIYLTLLSFGYISVGITRDSNTVVEMNITVKGKTPERKIGSLKGYSLNSFPTRMFTFTSFRLVFLETQNMMEACSLS